MRFLEKSTLLAFALVSLLAVTRILGASNVPLGQADSSKQASKTETAPTKKAHNEDQTNRQNESTNAGSGLQVVRGPDDIAMNGDCATRTVAIIVRATKDIKGVHIAGGGLVDTDSKATLPSEAFELLQRRPGQNGCENQYEPIPADAPILKDAIATLHLRLRETWKQPGNFAGDLLLAPQQTSGAETLRFKVFFRPREAWFLGLLAILVGSLLSWLATIWWPRRRQMAVNEVLISRLDGLLGQLRAKLEEMSKVGAPRAGQTLQHIESIRHDRLQQLLDDKVLTVLTGGAPSQAGSVGVLEEIEGVTRVVSAGFAVLFDLWQSHPGQETNLVDFFRKLDGLGARVASKDALEPDIKNAVDGAQAAIVKALQDAGSHTQVATRQLPDFEQEDAVVQRVIRATAWLDVASITAIVLAGVYVLIWKNPGFGNVGDLLAAFFWGLGLKVGADSVRIAGGDVRTAMGIKIPSA